MATDEPRDDGEVSSFTEEMSSRRESDNLPHVCWQVRLLHPKVYHELAACRDDFDGEVRGEILQRSWLPTTY